MQEVKLKYDERFFRPSIKFDLKEGIFLELRIEKRQTSLKEFFNFLKTLPYSKVDFRQMKQWYYEGRMRG